MIRKKGISAFICTICMLVWMFSACGFSAAENTPAGEDRSAETFVFVNEYASAGSYTLELSKTIEGREFREGERFVFDIEAENGAPLPRDAEGNAVSAYTLEIAKDEAGKYTVSRSLPEIRITREDLGGAASGKLTYRITERAGSEMYMNYDPAPKTLTLLAEDQGDGTIRVTRVPEDGEESTIFTNKYIRNRSTAVVKSWEDADNQDGKRPEVLLAELHRRVTGTRGENPDGKETDETVLDGVRLSEENNWTYRTDGLPCWDKWGNEYTYYWKEYSLTGEERTEPAEDTGIIVFNGAEYTCEARNTEKTEKGEPLTETSLTNQHDPALTDLTVRKAWEDNDNAQGMRPKNITVLLYANNKPTGLSIKLGGEPAFTNRNTAGTYRNVRCEGVSLGEETDPFAATLKNLPVYVKGVVQEYSWVESDRAISHEGREKSLAKDLYYMTSEYKVDGNTTTITNRYDPQMTSLTLLKAWDDAEDRNGMRPDSVQVTLRAVNADFERSYTIGSETGWRLLAADLPRILDGKVLEYEWTEDPAVQGYIQADADGKAAETIDADAGGERTAVITNKLPMGTLKVTKKTTSDDGKIPKEQSWEFTVTRTTKDGMTEYISPEGKPGTEEIINRIRAGETVTFANLSPGTYTVTEAGIGDGGSAQIESYSLTAETENGGIAELAGDGSETGVTLTNTYIRKRGTLTVTKEVTGVKEEDKAGKVFRVRVKAEDGEYYRTDGTAAKADSAWTEVSEEHAAVWKDLPYGVYTVEEEAGSAGIDRYVTDESQSEATAEIRLDDLNGGKASATIRNAYLPMLGALEITKEITGTDVTKEFNALRIRIRGPEGFDRTVTYDLFTDGKYTLREIPSGEYTVTEENADGIAERLILRADSVTSVKAEVTRGETAAVRLVNRYDVITTTVTVRKVWDDRNNQDGIRPASIVMTLSNGMKAELNEGNEWTAAITDLPLYDAAGNAVTYTWTEPEIKGYRQEKVSTEGSETIFTNKHTPEVTEATVIKVWDDADNAAGLRPANLRVTLSNGTSYYLNEANGWTVTVTGLPAYAKGKRIEYTWSEQSVLGYTKTSEKNGKITTFINSCPVGSGPEDGEKKTVRMPDNSLVTIEELPTALGVGGIINHVGDTFE